VSPGASAHLPATAREIRINGKGLSCGKSTPVLNNLWTCLCVRLQRDHSSTDTSQTKPGFRASFVHKGQNVAAVDGPRRTLGRTIATISPIHDADIEPHAAWSLVPSASHRCVHSPRPPARVEPQNLLPRSVASGRHHDQRGSGAIQFPQRSLDGLLLIGPQPV